MRERLRDDDKKVCDLTVEELEDLVFKTVKSALDNHYKGLVQRWYNRWDNDNEALLDGFDQVISILKSSDKQ